MESIRPDAIASDADVRLRTMADVSPALMWMTDVRGRCVHVNRRWLEFTGRTLDQELGDGWGATVHPEDVLRVRALMEAHVAELQPYMLEYRRRRYDGTYHWIRDQAGPWMDARGAFAGYAGTCFDITDTKQDEETLRAFESRLQGIMDTNAATVFLLGRDGRYLLVNREWHRLFNPDNRLVVGRHFEEMLPASAVERSRADNRRVFEHGETVRGEQIFELDGVEHCLLVNKVPVRDAAGNINALCGIAVDITDRKNAERKLRESERRLEAIVDSTQSLVFLVDRDDRILFANRTWREMFMPEGSDPVGLRLDDLFAPDVVRSAKELHAEVWRTGHAVDLDREGAAGADGRVYRVNKFLLRGDDDQPYALCTIGIDITDRVRSEEERRRMDRQIQHAQKLESLGVLAGGIAHDFNNLLVGVLGNAGMALAELPVTSTAYASVKQIEIAAMRAAELTRQMLAYSGKGRFVVQPLDLSGAVEEIVSLLQTVISKRAVMRFDFARGIPPIEADATQIRQVIMNLITNASDAIGDRSGVIVVRTGVMHADADYLRDGVHGEELPPGAYAYVEVSDNGIGMDAETRKRIFDPFFSTKFTGRGLGLSAVLGIVRGHRGAIRVYSEPGTGSNFKALFPCTANTAVTSPEEVELRADFRGEGTVLVVDDDETVRSVARMALERAGFRVLLAEDGRDGLRVWREHAGEIRLVLLDLTMPHMGGEEAARELRRIAPELPVVLMSGYNSQEVTTAFVGHGLAGFLQKPFRIPSLLASIQTVLAKRPPAEPH